MHEEEVETIRKQLVSLPTQVSLKNRSHPSNTTRSSAYKDQTLNINSLNKILAIDPVKQTVLVEPRVTMEQLMRATLKHGFVIPIVPEFKGITVGGAVMGAGIESSSHRFGLFSDTCVAYEILLGDGTVVHASPETHDDLFYGIAGSYGSLGVLLSIKIKLIPAKPWIKLYYRRASSAQEILSSKADFIEGFIFSQGHITVVEGYFSDEDDAPILNLKPWNPWFYQHVKKALHEEKISTFDYLFRHDRGAFWMGAYANLKRSYKLLQKDPHFLFRLLWGWKMTSRNLYSRLHAGAEDWVSGQFVIQDCSIPSTEIDPFLDKIIREIAIFPLWLCPAKTTQKPQIFSPHFLPGKDLINVGVYGVSPKDKAAPVLVRQLEQWTTASEGRKMLYGYSYYTNDEFWRIYPKDDYEQLRRIYHADRWLHITTKILQ